MELDKKLSMWRWPECDNTGHSEIVNIGNWLKVTDRDGKLLYDGKQFTLSLDAGFRYLVPERADVRIRENVLGQFTSAKVKKRSGEEGMGIVRWEEESDRTVRTAVALCRAMEHLMDGEED